MELWVPILGIIGTFTLPAIIVVVVVGLRHRERMELIKRGIVPEESVPAYPKQTSLFLGFLCLGLGIGGLVYGISANNHLTPGAVLLVGAGISLLAYWWVTRADRERKLRFIEEYFAAKKSKTPTALEEKTAGDVTEK